MKRVLFSITAASALLLAGMPLLAQRNFSATYDSSRQVKLQGVVTLIQWTNPHAHIYLDVVENGTKTNWNFEMASPNILERNGWSRKALGVNDQVTVEGYSGRVVTTRGFLTSITLSDGRKLFASPGPGSDAPYQ